MPTARPAPAGRLPASTLPAPAGTGPRLLPWTTALTGAWIPGCDPGLQTTSSSFARSSGPAALGCSLCRVRAAPTKAALPWLSLSPPC